MILHPQLKHYTVAVEVLHRFAAILRVLHLQPNEVGRVVEEVGDQYWVGYKHYFRTDDSCLDLSYELFSISEYSPIFVRLTLVFADNQELLGSRIIYLEYNCSTNEWLLVYKYNEAEADHFYESVLAEDLAQQLRLTFEEKRLIRPLVAMDITRIMAEFYARYKAQHEDKGAS